MITKEFSEEISELNKLLSYMPLEYVKKIPEKLRNFFKEFESINSVILPLVIFDLTQRKPMMIISFDKISDASLLAGTGIVVLECMALSDLLTNDNIAILYKI